MNATAIPSGPVSISCSISSSMTLSSLVCIRFSLAKDRTGMEPQRGWGHGPNRTEQPAQPNFQTSGCTNLTISLAARDTRDYRRPPEMTYSPALP